jgi:endonuclease/exonuclease/phosphatase family metal-dependent hydrolase
MAATSLVMIMVASGCASPVRMVVAPGPHAGCRAMPDGTATPAVTWVRPDHDDERHKLDQRCAEVGRPLVVAATTSSSPAQRVLVATWNMHDGRGDILALVETLRQETRDRSTPDGVVVLLQEVVRATSPAPAGRGQQPGGTGVQDIPPLVQRLGWHFAYVPGKRNRLEPDGAAAADRGIAILSSLPITDLEAIELPLERQRRVALSGVVHGMNGDGRPWRLRVVSVHLENRSGVRRFWSRAGASRTRQTEAFLDALSLSATQAGAAPLPTVVGGDFNTWLGPQEQALRLLRSHFGPWPGEDPRQTVDFPGWRLDYLFPRLPDSVRTTHRRLDSTYGSDHYPVVAAIDFGAN